MTTHLAAAVPLAEPDPTYAGLFAAHFPGLVRLAGLLGADDPEDVAQEAFVRLHRRRRLAGDPDDALPYLRRIVANLCRSRHRHLAVVRRTPPDRPRDERSAEDAVIAREDQRAMLAAFATLPSRQREVLVLRYWLDLPLGDIAGTLGMPVGTVKSTLSRGMAALARSMEDHA